MSLVIRFSRVGKRGERKFRVVLKEKRSKRDGDAIEYFGWYEKRAGGVVSKKIDTQKIAEWVKKGAQVSPSVQKVL